MIEKFQDKVDFIDFQQFKDLRKIKQHKIRRDCKMPFRRPAIFANGDVAPCCSFFSKKLIIGNIQKMTIQEIWDSPAMNRIRDGLISGRPVYPYVKNV
ncbi:MAG: SPASM domain-containing protein [Deltaproteobacteria bacterium]|nr:SPASM domain-containing protein [Deltaproteobacteria bacterium]